MAGWALVARVFPVLVRTFTLIGISLTVVRGASAGLAHDASAARQVVHPSRKRKDPVRARALAPRSGCDFLTAARRNKAFVLADRAADDVVAFLPFGAEAADPAARGSHLP